jgi:hypothetical protein
MPIATSARRASASGSFAMAKRLSKMLKKQIAALEADKEPGFSESRVKALMLLAKTLQTMEALEEKGETQDAESSESEDILEFRSRLERQLQALDG